MKGGPEEEWGWMTFAFVLGGADKAASKAGKATKQNLKKIFDTLLNFPGRPHAYLLVLLIYMWWDEKEKD